MCRGLAWMISLMRKLFDLTSLLKLLFVYTVCCRCLNIAGSASRSFLSRDYTPISIYKVRFFVPRVMTREVGEFHNNCCTSHWQLSWPFQIDALIWTVGVIQLIHQFWLIYSCRLSLQDVSKNWEPYTDLQKYRSCKQHFSMFVQRINMVQGFENAF